MSNPQTVPEFVNAAKAAILAGNLDEAETLTKQAQALKAVEAITPPAEIKRLDMTGMGADPTPPVKTEAVQDAAIKSFFITRYPSIEDGAIKLASEFYQAQGGYKAAYFHKYQAFKQFIRTGWCDPAYKSMLLYTPAQLMAAALEDGFTSLKATQIESQDSLGGFSVPEDFRSDIVERLPGLTVVRPRADVQQTTRDIVSFLKRTGGNSRYTGAARVTWTDEQPASATTSATNTTFGKVSIPVHVTLANVVVSRSSLEDSAVDLVKFVRDELTYAMAIDEDEQFLVGNGVGKPQGILNGASGGPFDSDVQTKNSGAAAALTGDALVATPMLLDGQYRQSPGLAWVAAKGTYSVIYQLKDGQGRYLWRNNLDNLAVGPTKELLGYPVAESEVMPAIAANNYPYIYGDFKRGYKIADRIGMSLERYQDSNTQATDSVIFYARRRLGGQVVAGWAFVVGKVST